MIDPERPDYACTPAAPTRPTFDYEPAPPRSGPMVSVITPFYNTDDVVFETAQSLLFQSLQNFEWVIVDDGSTEKAAQERLRVLQSRDKRVRVFRQDNAGPAAARNAAVARSSAPYLCLLDSDDLLEPTFIEKCVWFLESNSEFAFCNAWTVNFGEKDFLWAAGFERGAEHLDANVGPTIAIVRRAAYEAVGGFDESIRFGHEDWDFWLALAKEGYWGYTLPEYLAWYRKRASGRLTQVMSAKSVHRDFQRRIATKYAGLRSKFPAPVVKSAFPFETPSKAIPVDNLLQKPAGKKRILFIVPWMVTGGADKVNLDWVGVFRQNGYEVSICATLASYHRWQPEFEKLTPDVFVLPAFLRCADYPRFLRYLVESRGIELVLISQSTFAYLILPYLRANLPGVTFVDLCHAEEPHWMNGGHPRFAVGYQDLLDLNLVTTSHLRDWMVARGAEASRIAVCYSGINVAELDRAIARAKASPSDVATRASVPVVVFAGRICEQKRPVFLAEILRVLLAKGIEFQAIIIGDGELRPLLEDKLRADGTSAVVQMLGTVSHDVWLDTLARSHVFLLPSAYEGISVALLEAMGMGVVPVTAAVGGQAELVGPESGHLVAPGDSELDAYVDALANLLSQPEKREAMGRGARKRILAQFDTPNTAAQLLVALDRAATLSVADPRLPIATGYAQETATLAVEYMRMNGLADYLWNERQVAGRARTSSWRVTSIRWFRASMTGMSGSPIGLLLRRSPRLHRFGKRVMARVRAL